ncbi:BMP family protein [Cutibacterium sp.]|uniref:BMP family lipoprotein n=1 Tax=Cutibacterium sp. TaxID=1912221 RepID=UPI0026DBEA08|nr:BMP family ABC transporter substrate-binding protein [Cutibacterium sp.]MDO4413219.1 BMP family ABC transporter substrate-binding protein [Cutibacterium sp.]
MKKSHLAIPAVFAAAALSLSACAQAPDESSGSSSSSAAASANANSNSGEFKACMVSDSAGFNDKSFNETSLKGLTKAASDLGAKTAKVESKDDKDYATNLQSMIDAKCSIIVSVGFLLEEPTLAAAKANPNVKFAIVDDNPQGAPSNLKPLIFNTAQSSFEAGYLAASLTKTGKVATFGGMKIPTVTIFMDGFAQGVDYYNKQKNKSVKVIGWNAEKQDGQFVPQPNPFQNVSGGKTTAQALLNQGADIILPVAGNAGNGALQAVKSSGGKANAIWVDGDGCETQPSYCSNIITSVYKGMDVAVFDAIKAAKDGSFDNKPYIGSLEDGGTGLSPFHEFDSKVPAEVKEELNTIKADIASGKIEITSKAQPK